MVSLKKGEGGEWYKRSASSDGFSVDSDPEKFMTPDDSPPEVPAVNFRTGELPPEVHEVVATLIERAKIDPKLSAQENLSRLHGNILQGLPIKRFMPTAGPTYLFLKFQISVPDPSQDHRLAGQWFNVKVLPKKI